MSNETGLSVIEKMLGFEFVSDPRKAKYPIPTPPEDFPEGRPYPFPAMKITPDMAKDVLKHRIIRLDRIPRQIRHDEITNNRRFLIAALKGSSRDKGWIQRFKDGDMHEGTTDAIDFTSDGFLLDGQHRMAACAISGKPFWVPVTVQTPWSTFAIKDTGRGRSAGQLLGEVPYADYCAAAARLILPVVKGTERTDWTDKDAANGDIYNLVHGWPEFLGGTWMREVLSTAKTRVPTSALAASVIMALAAGADPFHVQSFIDGLKPSYRDGYPGFGDGGDDPRYLLRRKYMGVMTAGKKGSAIERRQQVGHVRQAMTVWLDHVTGIRTTEITSLRSVSETSSLPEVWNADAVRKYHREKVS